MILIFYDGPTKHLSKIQKICWRKYPFLLTHVVDGSKGYTEMYNRFKALQNFGSNHRVVVTNCVELLSCLKPNEEKPYYNICFFKKGQFVKLEDIYPNIRITNNIEKMYRANVFTQDIEEQAKYQKTFKQE